MLRGWLRVSFPPGFRGEAYPVHLVQLRGVEHLQLGIRDPGEAGAQEIQDAIGRGRKLAFQVVRVVQGGSAASPRAPDRSR